MAKKIEEKYQELSEIQHILNRPGMWVGSIKTEEKDAFVYNSKNGKFVPERFCGILQKSWVHKHCLV